LRANRDEQQRKANREPDAARWATNLAAFGCLQISASASGLLTGTNSGAAACFAIIYIHSPSRSYLVQIRAALRHRLSMRPEETPMVLMLSIEPRGFADLLSEHRIKFSPDVVSHDYADMFGNTCTRIVAPPGLIEIRNDFLIADCGRPDAVRDRCAAARGQRIAG